LQKYASFICLIHSHEKTCDFLFYFFGFLRVLDYIMSFLKGKIRHCLYTLKMLFFPFLNLKNAFLERIHPSVQLKKRTQKTNEKRKKR